MELNEIMPRANNIALSIYRWPKPNRNLFSYGSVLTVWHLELSVREPSGSAATAVGTVLEWGEALLDMFGYAQAK